MFGFAEVAEVEEWPARSPRAACVLALVPLVSFLILVYAVATGRRWKMDKVLARPQSLLLTLRALISSVPHIVLLCVWCGSDAEPSSR
jgi:hypothetical protein